MKTIKKILSVLKYILFFIILALLFICIWHNVQSAIVVKKNIIPGDMIEIYDNEKIHIVKMGSGDYTIVFLPGMGTASPYYDYYKLATLVSSKYQVLIVEPLGYGFSDNTDKERSLDNYEYELSKVLDYYDIKDNIILLGHSYSGISNLNYANKHSEVKGLVCLDCTTAYQIETHVQNGQFTEEVPKTSKIYEILSPSGLVRFAYTFFMKDTIEKELLVDVPEEYHELYNYFLYNKTMNKTIINEINDIYYNQLKLFNNKYNSNIHVLTILSDETVEEMKEYKSEGDFYHDWEEMHNLLISNNDIQKIHILKGGHYIHHGNTEEINALIDEMIININ